MSWIDASTWRELATGVVLLGGALGALRQWIVNPLVSAINSLRSELREHEAEHVYLVQLPLWTATATHDLNHDREMRGLEPLPNPPVIVRDGPWPTDVAGRAGGRGAQMWPDAQPGPSAHT